jgi:hypothetical protein
MRRLFWLALIGAAAWYLLNRDKGTSEDGATIGYGDGSSVTLDPGAPELDRLLQIAAQARQR